MGFVSARVDGDGQTRYAAMYADVKGRQRSAGKYATEAQARRAGRQDVFAEVVGVSFSRVLASIWWCGSHCSST